MRLHPVHRKSCNQALGIAEPSLGTPFPDSAASGAVGQRARIQRLC